MEILFIPMFLTSMDLLPHLLTEHRHTLVLGSAGTGKSTLLGRLRLHLTGNTVVLAPTGIAALHVAGETIHGFFSFKPGITPDIAEELGHRASRSSSMLYRALTHIIIDEISMVRADLMDAMDRFLRAAREDDRPFGGIQLWCFGDMLQLPPVVTRDEQQLFRSHYSSPYFYDAHVFQRIPCNTHHWAIHELTINYRQQDEELRVFLDTVRAQTLTPEVLEEINTHLTARLPQTESIYLTTTNKRALEINTQQLATLPGPVLPLHARIEDEVRTDQYPCASMVEIKVGARIMLVNNDPAGRWQNGSLGYIDHIDIDHIVVQLDTGKSVRVKECTWDIHRMVFDEDKEVLTSTVIGKFHQYPLTLAWAITIHKAQGKSFDHVHVDLEGGAFTEGQTYVALSRARTLQGLTLERPLRTRDLRMPTPPLQFLSQLRSPIDPDEPVYTETWD